MQLMEYLPLYFKNIREFQWIMSAEQPEMDLIYQGIEDYINDQFYNTLTLEGCKRWEQALGIKPSSSQTLEQRRLAIKAKANDLPPYTFKAVHDLMVALFGEDGFILFEDTAEYTLMLRNLTNDRNKWLTAIDILEKLVPCHVIIDPGLWYRVPFCGTIYCGTYWRPSTLGHSDSVGLQIGAEADAYGYDVDLCGTLPEISTLGLSDLEELDINADAEGFDTDLEYLGNVNSGMLPNVSTLGHSDGADLIAMNVGYLHVADLEESGEVNAGTIPAVQTLGYSGDGDMNIGNEMLAINSVNLPSAGTLYCGGIVIQNSL